MKKSECHLEAHQDFQIKDYKRGESIPLAAQSGEGASSQVPCDGVVEPTSAFNFVSPSGLPSLSAAPLSFYSRNKDVCDGGFHNSIADIYFYQNLCSVAYPPSGVLSPQGNCHQNLARKNTGIPRFLSALFVAQPQSKNPKVGPQTFQIGEMFGSCPLLEILTPAKIGSSR
jgi:hypothetical protein